MSTWMLRILIIFLIVLLSAAKQWKVVPSVKTFDSIPTSLKMKAYQLAALGRKKLSVNSTSTVMSEDLIKV